MSSRERLAQLLGSVGSIGAFIGIGGGPAGESSGGDGNVTLLERQRRSRQVRDGICTQQKDVQIRLVSSSGHDVQLDISVYETDQSKGPQATWSGPVPDVRPVDLLRALEVIRPKLRLVPPGVRRRA